MRWYSALKPYNPSAYIELGSYKGASLGKSMNVVLIIRFNPHFINIDELAIFQCVKFTV